MHLGRAGVEEHLDDLPRRRAAHDRVVDDHEPLAGDLGERVELHPDPLVAHPLLGLDERAVNVAVLDQPLAERDPARAGEADRGRRARVGDREHEVGLGGRLRGEPLAHPHAGAVHLDAVEPRVGPREVEELEDAERAAAGAGQHLLGAQAAGRRRSRARPGRCRGRSWRRRGRARRSPRRSTGSSPSQPSTSGRKPCASRNANSSPVGEPDDASRRPRAARAPTAAASSRGRSSAAIIAAITSLSEVEAEPRDRARRGARRRSSGCRCGRARPCAPGRGGSAAGR